MTKQEYLAKKKEEIAEATMAVAAVLSPYGVCIKDYNRLTAPWEHREAVAKHTANFMRLGTMTMIMRGPFAELSPKERQVMCGSNLKHGAYCGDVVLEDPEEEIIEIEIRQDNSVAKQALIDKLRHAELITDTNHVVLTEFDDGEGGALENAPYIRKMVEEFNEGGFKFTANISQVNEYVEVLEVGEEEEAEA